MSLRVLFVVSSFLLSTFAPVAFAEDSSKVYKFAVTDVVGLEELQREFQKFQEELSRLSGVAIKLYPVTNRTAVVESIRSACGRRTLSGKWSSTA